MQVRRPKSEDVAARAGVSRTTVSFVLNDRPGASISEATRQRVLAAAAELGYQPHASARGLAAGRTHTLGLVLRQSTEQVAEDALLAETLRGLSAAARAERYRVLVEPYGPTDVSYGDLVRSRRTDGLVVSGPRTDDDELLALARADAPVVIQGWLPDADLPSVDVDNVAAARLAVEHLIGLGHRVIGCITNAGLTYTAAAARLQGYREALEAAGILFDPKLVAEASFDAASGRRLMSTLLEVGDVTAVFVASDVVAFGAIAAVREAGMRVPDDVSVVGFDDIPLAAFFDPPLTTIRLPAFELGRAAGAALIDRIHGREVNARTVLPTELVIRSSTAPPRGHRGRSRDRPDTEPIEPRRRHASIRTHPSESAGKETRRMNPVQKRAKPAALLAAVALIAAACGSGQATTAPSAGGPAASGPAASVPAASLGQIGGSVSVLAVWAGAPDPKSEQYAFQQVLKPFTDATGITVNYTSTRDLNATITAGVASGNLPDIAGLPGPGKMIELANAGTLKPLDGLFDANAYRADTPGSSALEVNGKQYAEFFKGSIKGLIWYDPKVYTAGVPTSWDDLNAKATTALANLPGTKQWCIGLQSGAGSDGWPGTDWIEDFVIRQSGPDVYDKWVGGTQKWTSTEIKSAFTEFGKALTNSAGDANSIISTNFGKAGDPLFKTPPGCLFHHQASFITSFFEKDNPSVKAGTDYNFFLEPDINTQFAGAVTGGGDLLGMFNDTPQAEALMKYLITPQAQAIWPGIQGSGAISGSKSVDVSIYPDDITKAAATDLANAKIFRFDGSDAMPAAMSDAFLKAVEDFTKDQSKLDTILGTLDTVQSSAYGG